MAQLVIAAAGAALGGMIAPGVVAFGMTGASIGWMAGSMIGAGFGPTQKSEGPRLNDLSVSTSSYGTPIPYVAGHPRVAGQVVWASSKREIATTQSAGGKGGGGSEYTSYTYEVDLLILLSDNEIAGVSRIWSNGELIYSVLPSSSGTTLNSSLINTSWARITTYTGSTTQLPDPDYEVSVGTANAPAYRGRGSVFIKSLQLGGGGQIPNLTFEVCRLATIAPIGSIGHWSLIDKTSDVVLSGTNNEIAFAPFVGTGATCCRVRSSVTRSSGKYYVEFYVVTGEDPSVDAFRLAVGISVGPTVDSFSAVFDSVTTNFVCLTSYSRIQCTGRADIVSGIKILNGDVVGFAVDLDTHDVWISKNGAYIGSGNPTAGTSPTINFTGGGGNFAPMLTHQYGGQDVLVHIRTQASDFAYLPTGFLPWSDSSIGNTVSPINETLDQTVNKLAISSGLKTTQIDTTALSTITQPVRSMAISQVSSARTVLEMLAQTYHFDAVLSDKIYFKPRATASVATLMFDELGVGIDPNTDPLPLTTANELEIPAQMALTYNNVDGDYQTDTQYSDRLLTGQESTSAITVPLGFTASEAKQIVDGTLLDKAVSGLTTKVQLGITRAAIEPTDVITITGDDSSTYRMRVVKRTESAGVIDLECVQDDSTVFTQAGSTSGGTASQTTVAALATTTLALMDLPCLRDADNQPGLYAAVTGSATNWTSAAIYDSLDDVTYTTQTTVSTQAPIGTCTTTLGAWTGGNTFDETNTVTVNVGLQQLASTTWDGILANTDTNAALVGVELIQYRVATLVSAGVYTLSGLLRGRKGTASTGHVAAERFVALSTTAGLRFLALQSADLARLRYYKGVSASQALSAVTAQSITPLGNTLKPFAPVDARANRATTDTVLTWVRQTRLSTRIVGTLPMSIPLGETRESYEVEVWNATYTTLKRTLTASTPTVTYTSANQVTDFGSNQAVLYLKIYQLSATVGRGTALTASV